jgi:hypothetical protein
MGAILIIVIEIFGLADGGPLTLLAIICRLLALRGILQTVTRQVALGAERTSAGREIGSLGRD